MDLRPEFEPTGRADGRAALAVLLVLGLLIGLITAVSGSVLPAGAQDGEPAGASCAPDATDQAVDLPSGETTTFCYGDEEPAAAPTTTAVPAAEPPAPPPEVPPADPPAPPADPPAAPTGSESTPAPRLPSNEGIITSTAAISVVKTVGTDAGICAVTDVITVPAGTEVTYCYEVTNTGSSTMTTHDLVDDRLGALLSGFPYVLSPGARAFLTASAVLTTTTVNLATWTARTTPATSTAAVATDTATVNVAPPERSITLDKTVGTDPGACAATDAITVPAGTEVTYCYEVTNTGDTTFNFHNVDDDQLGLIGGGLITRQLDPGASAFYTASATLTGTTVNVATWQALESLVSPAVVATDTATVTVLPPSNPAITLVKTVGTEPSVCAATDVITVTSGTQVTYCYQVTNTGNVTLTTHDLVDDRLGTLLDAFVIGLGPGQSAFHFEDVTLTDTTVNVATWTASPPVTGTAAVASDSATVNVEDEPPPPTTAPPPPTTAGPDVGPDDVERDGTLARTGTSPWGLVATGLLLVGVGGALWSVAVGRRRRTA